MAITIVGVAISRVGWQSPESWGGNYRVRVAITIIVVANHHMESWGGNFQRVGVAIIRELGWQSQES